MINLFKVLLCRPNKGEDTPPRRGGERESIDLFMGGGQY